MNNKELVQKILDASIGKYMKENFEEIDREEKKKMRNDKINDLLNGEEGE